MNQTEVAEALGVPLSTYATWELKGTPQPDKISAVAKLFGYKYQDLIDESFIVSFNLGEPEKQYKRLRKPIAKTVDADSVLIHDTIAIKAMLRVMLRTQAEIIAAQTGISVSSILKKLSKAVRDETKEEFDEL